MNVPSFEIELKLLQHRSEARIALVFDLLGFAARLDAEDAVARLNEEEAVVLAPYLEQFDQFLFPKCGERRNGGEGLLSEDPNRFPKKSKRFPNYDGMMYE